MSAQDWVHSNKLGPVTENSRPYLAPFQRHTGNHSRRPHAVAVNLRQERTSSLTRAPGPRSLTVPDTPGNEYPGNAARAGHGSLHNSPRQKHKHPDPNPHKSEESQPNPPPPPPRPPRGDTESEHVNPPSDKTNHLGRSPTPPTMNTRKCILRNEP